MTDELNQAIAKLNAACVEFEPHLNKFDSELRASLMQMVGIEYPHQFREIMATLKNYVEVNKQ